MELTRRNFIGLSALGVGAASAAGLMGCAPSAGSAKKTETQAAAADEHDWLGSAPEIADSDIKETKTCDLLIVGAGNGGMSAAATAADLGLDFMICEKTVAVQANRSWIGAVNTKYHQAANITVDKGKLLNELSRYASGKCDQKVWKVWIDESAEMIDWMGGIMGRDADLDLEGYDHASGGTDYFIPPIQHMFGISGMGDVEDRNVMLERHIQELGYEVSYQYDLKKLMRREGGKVEGAIFQTPDGYVQVNAKNTILATGGYPANRQMMRELEPNALSCIAADGYMPNNDGYGIRAAMWVGAQKDIEAAPMIFDRGAILPGEAAGYTSDGDDATFVSTYGDGGQCMLGSQPFMKVARTGRRFANESTPYDFICHAAGKQPDGVWAQIFDSNAAEDAIRFSTIGCSKIGLLYLTAGPIDQVMASVIDRGFLIKADTIEELADGLGFAGDEKAAFLDEVERYNTFYDNQVDEDFGKEPFRLSALRKPPYYGMWYGGTLLTTLDGLCINENMQVIDTDNKVIDGLYAIGDCSGSLFSGNYPEYIVGCAVGRTITFGRHAVRYIVGDLA